MHVTQIRHQLTRVEGSSHFIRLQTFHVVLSPRPVRAAWTFQPEGSPACSTEALGDCLQAARASEWLASAVEQGQTLVASLLTFVFVDVLTPRQVPASPKVPATSSHAAQALRPWSTSCRPRVWSVLLCACRCPLEPVDCLLTQASQAIIAAAPRFPNIFRLCRQLTASQ